MNGKTNPTAILTLCLSMSRLNVHFKQCEGTYIQTLDRMLESGAVSARGLKPDAKVFGELVFDVNTAYFEERGGYEYAKQFFRKAFHFAEKEIGGDYILSAVMHADERNRSLSDELGRDVYHYHLHVTYIPVVDKEIKWSKRCKDKSLVGTTKEIICQISHSKKWAFVPAMNEQGQPVLNKDGKPKLIPSYSLLQDRFFEYMRAAGFGDFERGVKSSTAEHLSVIEYKVKQDTQMLSALEERIQTQQNNLTAIERELIIAQKVRSSVQVIEYMGRQKWFGSKVELTKHEFTDLTALAKEGIASRRIISDLQERLNRVSNQLYSIRNGFDKMLDETRDFYQAMRIAPQRVKEVFSDIFQKAKEAREQKKLKRRQYRGRNR
ncbi:MAG: Plasmid recombination enzyme [Pelotomaculum sp. PtaU1.Bin065]|nr:MAG: Plasmid recombination enzyme [Pelotomaculum sp. PtaU1.Bin065]